MRSLKLPRQATIAELSPRYRTIDAFERRALAIVLDGCAFAQLCEQLAGPEDAERAVEQGGGLLGAWLQDGLVCSAGSAPRA